MGLDVTVFLMCLYIALPCTFFPLLSSYILIEQCIEEFIINKSAF